MVQKEEYCTTNGTIKLMVVMSAEIIFNTQSTRRSSKRLNCFTYVLKQAKSIQLAEFFCDVTLKGRNCYSVLAYTVDTHVTCYLYVLLPRRVGHSMY